MSNSPFISAKEKTYFEGILHVLQHVKTKDRPQVIKRSLEDVDRVKLLKHAKSIGCLEACGISTPSDVGLDISMEELFGTEASVA